MQRIHLYLDLECLLCESECPSGVIHILVQVVSRIAH